MGNWARRWKVAAALIGIVSFVVIASWLEEATGFASDTSMRIASAGVSLWVFYILVSDYPRERWPQIGFAIAAIINVGIFFTPQVDRPTSRGELMFFVVADAVAFLAAKLWSFRPSDDRERAIRQQLILGLIVALMLCACQFFFAFRW